MIRESDRTDHSLAHELQDTEDVETSEAMGRAARQLLRSTFAGRAVSPHLLEYKAVETFISIYTNEESLSSLVSQLKAIDRFFV